MKKPYLKLFTTVFLLSAMTFGGGYVMIPIIKEKYVRRMKWLKEEELINLMAVAQTSPGAIAVNTLFLTGYKVAGVAGAGLSVIAAALPPLIVISALVPFLGAFRENRFIDAALKGTRAGVAAVILSVAVNFTKDALKSKTALSVCVIIFVFAANVFFKINAFYIILICIAFGVSLGFTAGKRSK